MPILTFPAQDKLPTALHRGWRLSRPPLDIPITLNRASPQANGLIGWWSPLANRGKSGLADLSRNSINAAFYGGVVFAIKDDNVGFRGNGSDAYIDLGNSTILSQMKSVAFWINTRTTNYEGSGLFCKSSDFSGASYECGSPPTVIRFGWGVDQVELGSTPAGWHHVVYADLASRPSLYLDGVLRYTFVTTHSPNNSNPLYIGRSNYGGANYLSTNITIGDFRVYQQILSPLEIQALYAPQTRWDLYLI